MGRETGTDPGGDKLREGNLVSAADIGSVGRAGRDEAVKWDEPRRRRDPGRKTRSRSTEPRALWRRRTSGEPSREDATREETDGANSQDEPKVKREADAEQRLRRPPGRVRKTLGGPRKRSGGERGTIQRKRYRPSRQALKTTATSDEERARIYSAAPKPPVRLKALEGMNARPLRPIPYLSLRWGRACHGMNFRVMPGSLFGAAAAWVAVNRGARVSSPRSPSRRLRCRRQRSPWRP